MTATLKSKYRMALVSETASEIRFIADAALPHAEQILRPRVRDPRRRGAEIEMLNPRRANKDFGSFKFNRQTGEWADFAIDASGSDLVSCVAYLEGGIDQTAAARLVADELGIDHTLSVNRKQRRGHQKRKPSKDHPTPDDFYYTSLGRPVVVWPYRDAGGSIVACTARYDTAEGKEFRPWHWSDDQGGWICKGLDAYPLYNLPELLARPAASVLFVEGEKTADAAKKRFPDFVAVTIFGGCKSWKKTDWGPLAGRTVVCWPDQDDASRELMVIAAQAATNNGAASTGIVDVPREWRPKGWDLANKLPAGVSDLTLDNMLRKAFAESKSVEDDENDWEHFNWPKLDGLALHGFAGQFSRAAIENSEADVVAVLITLLTYVGICVDRTLCLYVGDTEHHARLFALIIGATGRSRKGTSEGPVNRLFRLTHKLLIGTPGYGNLAGEMPMPRGLATGEGLAHAVRDADPDKEDNRGVPDKRLLIVESEFAQVLKQAKRLGNIINPTIRNSWDGVQIGSLIKTDKSICKKPHIGIVGHITRQEFLAEISDTDIANGFLNRFIMLCVRRSKLVALPPPMPDDTINECAKELRDILFHARKIINSMFRMRRACFGK